MVDKHMEQSEPVYHGGLAISSLVIGILAAIIIFIDFGVGGYYTVTGQASPAVNNLVGLVIIFSCLLLLLSAGLGIAGLFDKKSKKTLSIVGVVVSVGMIFTVAGFTAVGISMKRSVRSVAHIDDEALRSAILGSWTNPPESSDYNGVPVLETFFPNGYYSFTIYTDKTCTAVKRTVNTKYDIVQGVLISYVADGSILRDRIITISNDTMVLKSLEDGATYKRQKAQTCSGEPSSAP